MDEAERGRLKAWVETWKRAGPELDRIRREEIRAFRYEENFDIVDSLFEMALRLAGPPRETSGLVEQQRIFRKARP